MFFVLLLFLTLNVTPTKAESDYTENDIFYSIGSFINATMDGISTRLNEIEIINLGKNYARTLMDNGSRMSDIVRVRGNEFLFNPYGKSEIENVIDSVYGVYSDFANYAASRVEDDRYIININKTYTFNYGDDLHDGRKYGYMVVWANPNDNLPLGYLDYHHVSEEKIRKYNRFSVYGVSSNSAGSFLNYHRTLPGLADSNYSEVIKDGVFTGTIGENRMGVGAGPNWSRASKYSTVQEFKAQRIVFHNASYVPGQDLVPFNSDDIPTKEDFVSKIEGTYEPGNFYSYNMDELISRDTIINGDYVTNNYLTVEKYIGDSDYDDSGSSAGKDYTSVLDKILSAIKDLPKNIADKLDFPEGSGEEGGGFWSNLFGAIGDLASAMTSFITGVPEMFIQLFDGLLGLVGQVVELFVPNAEQVEELKGSLDLLVDDLTGKFDFVLEPVDQIKSVYSKPQSIYGITFEYDEQEIYLFPHFLKSSIDKLKVLLNGAVVLTTFITIYKRFVGREDLIK